MSLSGAQMIMRKAVVGGADDTDGLTLTHQKVTVKIRAA